MRKRPKFSQFCHFATPTWSSLQSSTPEKGPPAARWSLRHTYLRIIFCEEREQIVLRLLVDVWGPLWDVLFTAIASWIIWRCPVPFFPFSGPLLFPWFGRLPNRALLRESWERRQWSSAHPSALFPLLKAADTPCIMLTWFRGEGVLHLGRRCDMPGKYFFTLCFAIIERDDIILIIGMFDE